MSLTQSQKNAVEIINQNLQMVACAGSGKTTTMVKHILHLIKQDGIEPKNIVAVTYSKKAAASLKQKIYNEYEETYGSLEGLADMYIGTIHSYCFYLIQNYCDDFKNYDLLEEVQNKLFMKRFRKGIGIFDVQYHGATGSTYPLIYRNSDNSKLQEAIEAYKTFLDIAREHGIQKISTNLQNHIKKYESVLNQKYKFDYTSIITTALSLLQEGTFDEYIKTQIKYLIVDEYQDVNDAQENILKYFCNKGVLLCVVGDDDQTIYHWRGSNLTYIRDFQKRYSNVHREDLAINFRSSCGITDVARQVIQNNTNRLSKQMNSNNNQQHEIEDIIAYDFNNREDEVEFILTKIRQLKDSAYTKDSKTYGLDYDDMVVLVSSVKKIPELIQALEESEIDFVVEGTRTLFETKEIQAVCGAFNLIFNILDDYIDSEKQNNDEKPDVCPIITVSDELASQWKEFSTLSLNEIKLRLVKFATEFYNSDSYEYTIQDNLKSLLSDLRILSGNNLNEKLYYNLGKFTEIVNDFETIYLDIKPSYKLKALQKFLIDDAPTIYAEGWLSPSFKTIRSLRIMTYYQSKGLEFPVVFLPFLTQYSTFPLKNPGGKNAWGIFNDPSIKSAYENDEESHRRVFYVGITRSEKYLYMTRSPQPYGNNKSYKKPAQPYIEAKTSQYVSQETHLSKVYPVSEDVKFSNDEVITLNFSLLKDLFDCPFKFEMLNIFGFHSPLNIRMGYGRSVHNMLDYVHKNYKTIPNFTAEIIKQIVDRYLYLPYGSPLLKQQMKDKAYLHLSKYINNNKDNFQNILFSEKTIDYSINEYLFIDGRIDLVKDSLNNTITIVDFKSSKDSLSREQIKNQLMVYVLGYENLTGDKVDFIESYDFNNNDPTRIKITDNDKNLFKNKLSDCHKIIKESKYEKIGCTDPTKGKSYCTEIGCEFIHNCFPTA